MGMSVLDRLKERCIEEGTYSLACCPEVAEPVCSVKERRKKEQEKESTMGYNSANANLVVQAAPANTDAESKRHLLYRVNEVFSEKHSSLRDAYHLNEDYPKSGQETLDRILQGKYTLKAKTSDNYDDSRIIWRDPATPADRKGYDAAVERLEEARQKAVDDVTVLFPEMGLESLREFEKFDATVEAAATVH